MLRFLSGLCFTATLFAQGGWIDILPDERFTDWYRVSVPPGKPVTEPTQWKVDRAAGVLVCEGNGGHEMLLYKKEFGDFVFNVEWKYTKVEDPAARYNSGVYVRNNADGSIWHQAQAGQDGAFLFGKTPADPAPKGFNLKKAMTENRVKPVGEWNTFEITAQGTKLSLAVNGQVVSEFAECGARKGLLGLEAEGFRIEFRNLRVRTLDR